jgi:ankyrin repeat protein
VGVHTRGGDGKNIGVRISAHKFNDLLVKIIATTRKLIIPTNLSQSLATPSIVSRSLARPIPLTREGRERALILAVEENNQLRIEELLALDTDINARSRDQETPLMLACANRLDKIVNLLIENGADVDAVNSNGDRALELATRSNLTEAVRALVNEKAKLTKEDITNLHTFRPCPALHIAAGLGNVEIVRLLLDQGVQMKEIEYSSYRGSHVSQVTTGGNALNAACKCGHVPVVNLFLERDIDLNQTMSSGGSGDAVEVTEGLAALQEAVNNHHWEVVLQLLRKGLNIHLTAEDKMSCNVRIRTSHGERFILSACKDGALDAVIKLLEMGVKLDSVLMYKDEGYDEHKRYGDYGNYVGTHKRQRYRVITVGSEALEQAKGREPITILLRERGAKESTCQHA